MKEHPIIFSGPMVKAILSNSKTQTRRIVKLQPPACVTFYGRLMPKDEWWPCSGNPRDIEAWVVEGNGSGVRCPYGSVGSKLWVRETLRKFVGREPATCTYVADATSVPFASNCPEGYCGRAVWKWKKKILSSIHMPRWASRITLEITEIRVQRLQEISEEDAVAEGVKELGGQFTGCYMAGTAMSGTTARECYARLWDSINLKRAPWTSNPFVWAITFRVVK